MLRRATPLDARAIAEIHVRAWKAAYPGLLPQDYLDALAPEDRVGMWEEALTEAAFAVLVAEEQTASRTRTVTGFCSYGASRDDDVDPATTGELQTIYVDPSHWASGTGRALLDGAVTGLGQAGFAEATLWVLGVNEAARGFYEHLGWKPDGATKEHDWTAFVATDVRYRRTLR